MSDVVKVEGLDTLQGTMRSAARQLDDWSGPARQTSTQLAARGRADAPHRTGRLASSVRAAPEGDDAAVESSLEYATFVHWGTSRQRAQPWLAEGRDDTQEHWIQNYEQHIDRALEGVRGA